MTTDADNITTQMHTDFFDFLHKTPGTFKQKLEKMKEYGKEFPDSDFFAFIQSNATKDKQKFDQNDELLSIN